MNSKCSVSSRLRAKKITRHIYLDIFGIVIMNMGQQRFSRRRLAMNQ